MVKKMCFCPEKSQVLRHQEIGDLFFGGDTTSGSPKGSEGEWDSYLVLSGPVSGSFECRQVQSSLAIFYFLSAVLLGPL